MLKRRFVFGYGSLVNCRTHHYRAERYARLANWRREWRLTRLRPIAYLSVTPEPGAVTHGLVAEVPHTSWKALDLREAAYNRHDLAHALAPNTRHQSIVHVYSIAKDLEADSQRGSIYLSYIDVVSQGFMDHGGADGVSQFFASTAGWTHQVIDDRDAPRYNNASPASNQTRSMVDENLASLSVSMKKL